MAKYFMQVCIFLMIITSANIYAGYVKKEFDGYYIPLKGRAETHEVSRPWLGEPPTQLGQFQIILVRKGWQDLSRSERLRIRKTLILRGVMKGVLDEATFTLDHVMSVSGRDGSIYTENDVFIPESGDPVCSQGTPLNGVEIINVSMGVGTFENLSGGTLHMHGTVNNCPNLPDFLKNNFEVIRGVGGICFGDCEELEI